MSLPAAFPPAGSSRATGRAPSSMQADDDVDGG